MVQLAKRRPTVIYTVMDDGRTIGRIEAPEGLPRLERGAATVLLRREPPRAA